MLCRVLGVPRSTYYSSRYKKTCKRTIERNHFKQEIQSIYNSSKGIYGAPKIHKILSLKYKISIKRVQRIMSELGLKSVFIRKFKHYSTKGKVESRDNLLNQDFSTKSINEKWVSDITYIHTVKDGWCYLASVMDLHTKKIIGYAFDKRMTTDLIIRALNNAFKLHKYGMDPIVGVENLVWAPNGVPGQHDLIAITKVVDTLKAVDADGGDYDDMVEMLKVLGKVAEERGN